MSCVESYDIMRHVCVHAALNLPVALRAPTLFFKEGINFGFAQQRRDFLEKWVGAWYAMPIYRVVL